MSELSDLLGDLPIPEHRPGFWEELESRLAQADADHPEVPRVEPIRSVNTEIDGEPSGPSKRRRRVGLAILATAAAILIAVGINIVLGNEDDAPITVTDIPPTTSDLAPTTTDPTTTTPTPSGDSAGPLSFTEVPKSATGPGSIHDAAASFDGALVLLGDGVVLRTTDGVDWETTAGPPAPESGSDLDSLVASEEALVALGTRQWDLWGDSLRPRNFCSVPQAVLVDVAASGDGSSWTMSSIATPEIVDSLADVGGCVNLRVEVLASSELFLVVARLQTSFDESSYAARLLEDLEPELRLQTLIPTAAEAESGHRTFDVNGEPIDVPFDDTAYAAAQRRFSELTSRAQSPPDEPGSLVMTLAWASTDGIEWSPIEPTGPLTGTDPVSGAAATSDGFYLTNAQNGTIEFSSDLTNWVAVEDAIDFESFDGLQPLGDKAVHVSEGRVVGTDEVLYRPELVAGVGGLRGGELGLLGWHFTDDGAGRLEFVYIDQTGGAHSWTPPELEAFDPNLESLDITAVADDFAVLSRARDGTEQVLLTARPSS